MTGDKASADLDTAKRAGVDGVLVKPFSPERLGDLVQTIFSEKGAAAARLNRGRG